MKVIASSKVSFPVSPLPADVAACLSSPTAVMTLVGHAVEGRGSGCASFHAALAALVEASGSFGELRQQLLRPELFAKTVLGTAQELSALLRGHTCGIVGCIYRIYVIFIDHFSLGMDLWML